MCGIFMTSTKVPREDFEKSFQTIQHRGPDKSTITEFEGLRFGFHRLAIMDLSDKGQQPFLSPDGDFQVMCNGEIYNHKTLMSDYRDRYRFTSGSDCEVLIPLYQEYGLEFACKQLDAEFAFIAYDKKTQDLMAARDPIGIRPLFYGYSADGSIAFASEAKALVEVCKEVKTFPPGHYYSQGEFKAYIEIHKAKKYHDHDREEVLKNIHRTLSNGIIKRLDSDAPMGFLLSGGLDSSLVCAVAAKHSEKPIRTFAIGIKDGPIDTKYAKIVADYIGSDHTEVIFTREEAYATLKKLIYQLETFDITTIRAAMGMYLVCEYIHKNTDIKVIHTGEVSDELFGYKYTDFAPSAEEFQKEAEKRIKEIYMYDVLRADRSISAHALEARVPFSDKEFVEYVMAIKPELKMNTTGVGKHLLRAAFEGEDYLPHEILYREKAAFSDAVGHDLVDCLKELAEEKYTDEDVQKASEKYEFATPFTKESLMYRDILEEVLPGKAELVKDFWMPNKEWENCDVLDPSARVLPNYGKSGN